MALILLVELVQLPQLIRTASQITLGSHWVLIQHSHDQLNIDPDYFSVTDGLVVIFLRLLETLYDWQVDILVT